MLSTVVGGLVTGVALGLNVWRDGLSWLSAAGAVLLVAGTGLLVLLVLAHARTWRPWMTHLAIMAAEVHLMAMTIAAPDDTVVSVAYVSLLAWPAIYVSLYLPNRYAVVHGTVLTAFAWTTLAGQLGVPRTATVLLIAAPVFSGMALICSRLAAQLRDQAGRDALTGLLNRRGLDDAAGAISSVAERLSPGRSLPRRMSSGQMSPRRGAPGWTVVAVDLDGFKSVNDTSGHHSGDQLLATVAEAWTDVLRRGDVLARTGGDEFVLLLPCSIEDGVATVDRLRAQTPAVVGVSAGIATWFPSTSLDAALRRADDALYQAKKDARGTTTLATSPGGDPRPVPENDGRLRR